MRNREHDFFRHQLNTGRQIHVLLFEQGFRLTRRHVEEFAEGIIRHGQPLAVIEELHVHPKTAIRLNVDQMLSNSIGVNRLAVRGQSHQFVFAAVDFEATMVGNR